MRSLAALLAASLLAGCAQEDRASPSRRQAALTAPARPVLATLDELAEHPSRRTLLVEGVWGNDPGQFGRRPEASAPGPMRIVADAAGRLHVLDQVNRRIQVFDRHGALVKQIGPVPATAEDLVLVGERIWLVAQPGPGTDRRLRLLELDRDGRQLQDGHAMPGAVLLTGLFASGDPRSPDVWIELRHRQQIRVVHEGRLLAANEQRAARHQALGRPAGSIRLAAARTGRARASVVAVPAQPTTPLRPLLDLVSRQPIAQLLELASDGRGDVFLALATSRGNRQPLDRQLVVLPAGGGSPLRIDLVDGPMATDAFRPLAVGPDGAVFYQLQTSEQGVKVWRWSGGER